ncbi:hypothetical protein Ahy_B10g104566 [Arachis hypogaea]|uniref:RNase H type-1 domain-containing protein n=1 Tax=Arachis hypogaea TaxID=3818 RepID=A0A444X5V8_ARAHY|nr:hypothetical protein Ahy_B10g104566 [Arachis hypogaea]
METEFANFAEEPAISSIHDTRTVRRVTWRPPPPGLIKCNVDATFLKVFSGGATTAVFRDHVGNLLTASNSKIAASSPLAAEALTFDTHPSFKIKSLNCRNSSYFGRHFGISVKYLKLWVYLGNALAHEVAKLTADGSLRQNWLRCKSQIIMNILKEEHYISLQLANKS